MLLGLLDEHDCAALRILNALGVEPDVLRIGVENALRHASHRNGNDDTGLTPRAKYVIDVAVDEARRFNQDYVGTEHLLFGLVREGEGIAARTLKAMGASQERLRKLSLDTFGRLDTI